jgi:hypothetical protein
MIQSTSGVVGVQACQDTNWPAILQKAGPPNVPSSACKKGEWPLMDKQFLDELAPEIIAEREQDLPHLPINLSPEQQHRIFLRLHDALSYSVYLFILPYIDSLFQ